MEELQVIRSSTSWPYSLFEEDNPPGLVVPEAGGESRPGLGEAGEQEVGGEFGPDLEEAGGEPGLEEAGLAVEELEGKSGHEQEEVTSDEEGAAGRNAAWAEVRRQLFVGTSLLYAFACLGLPACLLVLLALSVLLPCFHPPASWHSASFLTAPGGMLHCCAR